MSSELIIIIVGAVFVLIAILDIVGLSLNVIKPSVSIPLGVIGILLIIYGGYTYGTVNVQAQIEKPETGNIAEVEYPVNKIQVISPLVGDSVACRILTMGVYPETHEKDIWVLLKPSDDKYYPQSDHTNTSYKMNGEWQVITRFGGDEGETFELVVYETDAETSQIFSSTIESWKAADSYPGIEEADLPSGAVEVERFSVVLKKNCRGVH